jgi:hypothetical protein
MPGMMKAATALVRVWLRFVQQLTWKIDRARVCIACPAGTFSNGTHCVPCAAGSYSLNGSSTCQLCPSNSQSNFSSSSCQCNAGYYSLTTPTTLCLQCPANSSSAIGASDLSNCTSFLFRLFPNFSVHCFCLLLSFCHRPFCLFFCKARACQAM